MSVRQKTVLLRVFGCACLILLLAPLTKAQTSIPREKVYVEMRATGFGGSAYVIGFAATDILNKKSTWVRGSVLESSGTPENSRVVGKDPAKRRRSFFTCGYDVYLMLQKGEPPFDKDRELYHYKDLMVMIHDQNLIQVPITLNPNIKTLADLKNKRVATWPKGTSKFINCYQAISGAGEDVVNSINWQFTAYGGYEDLVLGKVDAAWSFWPERTRGVFSTNPETQELMASTKISFVTATPEMRKKSLELFGEAAGGTFKIRAGQYAPGVPSHDIYGLATPMAFLVYADMPKEVVYEIVKTLTENHQMFKEYHPAGESWVPENLGAYPADKRDWHPGVRKYFDEKGIRYGKEYFYELYPMK